MTTPLYAEPVACQKCGGEIQGWVCQDCNQAFRETDDGRLIFDLYAAAAPAPDGMREGIARIVDPAAWQHRDHQIKRISELNWPADEDRQSAIASADTYVIASKLRADSILALLAGGEGR